MTALAGYWSIGAGPDPARQCERMLAAQKIYGPDGVSQDADGPIALGRNLYRTLPEDRFDRQPLSGGQGRWRMVADLRLDNRDELAAALAIDPAAAATMPDSAMLLAAWEQWRHEVFPHILGDYAFAVWDTQESTLTLARDALGERPLVYHRGQDFIAFASMPKGLHALPEVPYAPDEERVAELLMLLPEEGPQSYFAGIHRVESGHYVTITLAGEQAVRHWDPRPEALPAPDGDYVEGFRRELDRATRARLRGAEGVVASHLSGGWDSSAVTATAARLLASEGGKVVAFTSVPREGFDRPDPEGRFGDEGPLAAATAALYPNVEHVLVRPDGSGMLDHLDREFFLYERPLLNLCNQQWINAINAGAKQRGIRVMLTGAMGNMSISYAGNERLPELASSGRWLRLFREGRALVRARRMRWRGVLVASFGPWLPGWLWRGLHRASGRALNDPQVYSAIRPGHSEALGLERRAGERGLDPLYRPRKNGFETRLWVLRRVDQGGFHKGVLGGWGVDLRDPTSDRRLIEYCLSLPMHAFLADGMPRALGRRALADRLPAEVLDERRKGLQAADWSEGVTASRDALREEVDRLAALPATAEAMDIERLRALLDNWPEGGWEEPEVAAAYRLALLRGAASGHFLRKASRSNG